MDDNNFDKVVREKFDGYEDPSFDESALVDFQEKLAVVNSTPWYQQSFTYLGATLLALLTALLIFLNSPRESKNYNAGLSSKNSRTIDSLENVIKVLTNEGIAYRKQNTETLESAPSYLTLASVNAGNSDNTKPKSSRSGKGNRSNVLALGPVDQLPFEIYQALVRNGMLVDDNGSGYLVAPDRETFAYRSGHYSLRIRDVYHSPTFGIESTPVEEKSMLASDTIKKENEISTKKEEVQENQSYKGLGINIGPHADLTFGQVSKGKALTTPRVGFLVEVIVSPRFSFEGGIDYSTTSIDFDRDFQNIEIPNLDTSLGTINSAHIKNSLLSTPFSVKYRKSISERSQGFIRVGYTPYFTILQEYQCSYKANYSNPYQPPYGARNVTSILQVQDNFAYGSTSSISLGFTRMMKKKDTIEGSLFYETSLSAMGKEKLAMTLFGVRTAYWFNLK